MVPRKSTKSNSKAASNQDQELSTQWNNNTQALNDPMVLDELFDTLAQWNDYLENHTPNIKDALEL